LSQKKVVTLIYTTLFVVIALDVNQEWAAIGMPYWQEAKVDKKIELIIQPATVSLQQLIDKDGEAGTFDVAYIDADKTNYANYVELSYKLIKTNGLIIIDNTLWNGAVCDDKAQDDNTVALRKLNVSLKDDPRFDCALTTIADGVTFLRKK